MQEPHDCKCGASTSGGGGEHSHSGAGDAPGAAVAVAPPCTTPSAHASRSCTRSSKATCHIVGQWSLSTTHAAGCKFDSMVS